MSSQLPSVQQLLVDRTLAVPFVGGIIERQHEGRLQILLQTRWQDHALATYRGTIEFAAGVLDKYYENVYDALAREILEETGLTLSEVIDDSRTTVWTPNGDDGSFGFRPFCCTQQLRGGLPWVGFIFRCRVEEGEIVSQPGETRDVRWVDAHEANELLHRSPERFFTLEVPALDYYFREVIDED